MQFGRLRRREFIMLLGGAAVAWPTAGRAQTPRVPIIGYLHGGSPDVSERLISAFQKGLSEMGFVVGQNLSIEFRWARNDNGKLPAMAADLVRRDAAVIVTPASTTAAVAAKAATSVIPIVFGIATDPVELGLLTSLNRPGGNVTGITSMNLGLAGKQLGLLHELQPHARHFGLLVNPNNPAAEGVAKEMRTAAGAIGSQIKVLTASDNREIDAAFAALAPDKLDALVVSADSFFATRRVQLATLATRHAVPAIFANREIAEAGGLMSYGSSVRDLYRQVAIYAGRVLKGESTATLPVMRANKFEFVINLQTARALAMEVPPSLLAIADEVIE
jgi:putative tryptophan/tyrosine transport system substrate-binding protein